MRTPTIHINGTSADALRESFTEAYSKVGEAIKAVEDTGPNGRDYYPQGAGALKEATDEHVVRMQSLKKVQDDLLELAMSLDS